MSYKNEVAPRSELLNPIHWTGEGNCLASVTATAINSLGKLQTPITSKEISLYFKKHNAASIHHVLKELENQHGQTGVGYENLFIDQNRLWQFIRDSLGRRSLIALQVNIERFTEIVMRFPANHPILSLLDHLDNFLLGELGTTHAILLYGYSDLGQMVTWCDHFTPISNTKLSLITQSLPKLGIFSNRMLVGEFYGT